MSKVILTEEQRFWAKVDKNDLSGCWIWLDYSDKHGLQSFHVHKGKRMTPPRYSYELVNGPILSDIRILQTCHNNLCVNPDHLLIGTPENRFWYSVEKTDSCWLWTGTISKAGYGVLFINQKKMYTHRYSYELHNSSIPDGLHVLHSCDNPPCCNPSHLSTGTNLDNIHDKMNKDRSNAPKGERSWSARLTEDNVLEIRSKYAAGGISQKDLAIEYGVLAPAISQIINRKKWKHI